MVTNQGVQGVKGVQDVLGDGKINWYPGVEHIDKEALLACNFIIQDAKLVDDWDSEFGITSFFLVKLQADNGQDYTTILGGQAILKQLRKLKDSHRFPVACSMESVQSQRGNSYYVLRNPRPEVQEAK